MKVDRSKPKRRSAVARAVVCGVLGFVIGGAATGCGGSQPTTPAGAAAGVDDPTQRGTGSQPEAAPSRADGAAQDGAVPKSERQAKAGSRSRVVARGQAARDGGGAADGFPSFAAPPKHDDAKLAEEGIRRVASRRLVLYSDAPADELAGLGEAVDQLFDAWVSYFLLDGAPERDPVRRAVVDEALADWKVTGYLMADAELFARLGLFPAEVGSFPNARSRVIVQRRSAAGGGQHVRRMEFWLHDQKDDYYRRHLLLHEATHCFVDSVVGKPDATWYAEGIAELFATHVASVPEGGGEAAQAKWHFRAMPGDNDEVPGWGRIALIQKAVAQGRALSVAGVRRAPANQFLETEWYAWCWALATLLDNHPRYRDRFRRLALRGQKEGIDETFEQWYRDDMLRLEEEWQVFVANLEYGYDLERAAIDFGAGRPLEAGESGKVRVSADRGWQNSAVRLEPGRSYRVRASGRYSLAEQPKTWWCEPQGISFRYYEGKPLGRLVGAVRSAALFPETGTSGLLEILDVGDDAVLESAQGGTLYLRVNDAWGELSDNRGSLEVTIEAVR